MAFCARGTPRVIGYTSSLRCVTIQRPVFMIKNYHSLSDRNVVRRPTLNIKTPLTSFIPKAGIVTYSRPPRKRSDVPIIDTFYAATDWCLEVASPIGAGLVIVCVLMILVLIWMSPVLIVAALCDKYLGE